MMTPVTVLTQDPCPLGLTEVWTVAHAMPKGSANLAPVGGSIC